jgi:hypothetical protein
LRIVMMELQDAQKKVDRFTSMLRDEDATPYARFGVTGWDLLSEGRVLDELDPQASEAFRKAYDQILRMNAKLDRFADLKLGMPVVVMETSMAAAMTGSQGAIPPAMEDLDRRYGALVSKLKENMLERLPGLRNYIGSAMLDADVTRVVNGPSRSRLGREAMKNRLAKSRKEAEGDANADTARQLADDSGSTAPAPAAGDGGRDDDPGAGLAGRIAGLSVLKGLVLYGATLTFAGFYAYFMEQIASAANNTQPNLNTAMVSAAALLAGILGSAFALVIGVPVRATNEQLAEALRKPAKDQPRGTGLRRLLSLEPGGTDHASWPQTFGIWMYAAVATAVAIVYLVNQGETPTEIKALATAFGGYVIAFMTAAYGVGTSRNN